MANERTIGKFVCSMCRVENLKEREKGQVGTQEMWEYSKGNLRGEREGKKEKNRSEKNHTSIEGLHTSFATNHGGKSTPSSRKQLGLKCPPSDCYSAHTHFFLSLQGISQFTHKHIRAVAKLNWLPCQWGCTKNSRLHPQSDSSCSVEWWRWFTMMTVYALIKSECCVQLCVWYFTKIFSNSYNMSGR